jgi:hypothetical protein
MRIASTAVCFAVELVGDSIVLLPLLATMEIFASFIRSVREVERREPQRVLKDLSISVCSGSGYVLQRYSALQQFSARGYVQLSITMTLWLGRTIGSMRALQSCRCLPSQHIAIGKIKLNEVMNQGLD